MKVAGTQPGVKLYVDDKEIGPLPQEVRDLRRATTSSRSPGSERYQPLEKHVTVEKDAVQDLGHHHAQGPQGQGHHQARHAGRARLPGQRRRPARAADAADLGRHRHGQDLGAQASKPGFSDYSQPITFDDGQAEKTYTVTLDLKGARRPAADAAGVQPAAGGRGPAPAPAPGAGAGSPTPATPATTSGDGGDAFLNINSIPPSTCFLDGSSLGQTPKVHISVKPGAHTVKFVNSDQGLTKTISVTVGAGETKPAVAKLQ